MTEAQGKPGRELSTASTTIADLVARASVLHAGKIALRSPSAAGPIEVSYERLGAWVEEAALGLVALGIRPGDRVAVLAQTRAEWTVASQAILAVGATLVSIYATSSVEQCRYVLEHAGVRALFVDDERQLAKAREATRGLALEHVVVFEPTSHGALAFDALRELGRGRDRSEYAERVAAVRREDPCVIMYTSGTTGSPKGCVLTHGNYRDVQDMLLEELTLYGDEAVYLYLPLAHAFALLTQFYTLDTGGVIAYWSRDPQEILTEIAEARPTYLPSVPRVFEKLYAAAHAASSEPAALDRAARLGKEVRTKIEHGEAIEGALLAAFERADAVHLAPVRALFGGRIRQCVTGGAPIAPEILEFFYGAGVPVMEGYGMTETSTVATTNVVARYRFGSVGTPIAGVRLELAPDGEVLLAGSNVFAGYYRDEAATREALQGGWLRTGDLGHVDADGFLFITGRKKDVIITAGGKKISPAPIENELRQSPWIAHAIVVGDRRPYVVLLVTLDPEHLPRFAREHGIAAGDVARSPAMRATIGALVDRLNARVGPAERIVRFAILERDLDAGTELTPTSKMRRDVVAQNHAREIDALYRDEAAS